MAVNSAPYSVEWLGSTYRILLSAEQTESRIGVFESFDLPGYGPPRHIHNHEDETFYIHSGEVEFWVNGRTRIERAGSMVFVPRGSEHAFRVLGDAPARMLTIVNPGGFEGFFAEMERRKCRIPEDMDEIAAVGTGFNLTFTGPPLNSA